MWVYKIIVGVLALSPAVFGKEMAVNEKMAAELYSSGIMMDRIKAMKQVISMLWLLRFIGLTICRNFGQNSAHSACTNHPNTKRFHRGFSAQMEQRW
jgi:hypothetical protein